MTSRRHYTEEDKAQVFAALTANDGNVKRTSRETEIPEQTVRDWKKLWERKGLPAAVEEALPTVIEDRVEEMLKVRDRALDIAYDRLNDPKTTAKDATWIVGVLTDKIRLLRGEATSRTETVHTGPSPAEVGEALATALQQAFAAQEEREADIIDAEFTEQAPVALPPAP
jgi:transposase-like protein